MNAKSTLLQVLNPRELLIWMDKNLTYEGKSKGYLRTPSAVIEDKLAHCWESSELTRVELNSLECSCETIFVANKNFTVTHSAIIYQKSSKWFWFEWAWYKHAGISDFKSRAECIEAVISAFEKQYGRTSICVAGSRKMIIPGDAESDYINRASSMPKVIRLTMKKPKYSQWK